VRPPTPRGKTKVKDNYARQLPTAPLIRRPFDKRLIYRSFHTFMHKNQTCFLKSARKSNQFEGRLAGKSGQIKLRQATLTTP
jgi:hypothetical protein